MSTEQEQTEDQAVEKRAEIPEMDPTNPDVHQLLVMVNFKTGETSVGMTAGLTPAQMTVMAAHMLNGIAERVHIDETELDRLRQLQHGSKILRPGDPGYGGVILKR